MDRTFQHRFTVGAKSGIIVLALLAFYLFWSKSVVAALVVVVPLVAVIERVLHSCYVVREDDLVIHRGRFLRDLSIPLDTIRSIRPMTTTWGLVHYLLIEYGDQRLVSVEPQQEQNFVDCLRKRIAENKRKGGDADDSLAETSRETSRETRVGKTEDRQRE